MKQHVFEERHGPEWSRFEAWLAQRRRAGRDTVPAEEAVLFDAEMPKAYRRLCHQLALARDRRYGTDVVDRLHGLAIEAHQVLYGARASGRSGWLTYVFGGFARNVRAQRRFALAAAALFFVPFAAMIALSQYYPDAIQYILPGDKVNDLESMYGPGASRLGRRGAESDFYMFGFYIFNNVRIAFQTFAGGLLAGVGAIFFLVFNALVIGAAAGHVTAIGLGTAFWSFVAGHCALELGGIVLSGAAGLRLGAALVAPGPLTRRDALGIAGREAAGIMYGVAAMLVAAAFVEAFWSSMTVVEPTFKYLVGLSMIVLVGAYFVLAGRARAA